MSYAFTLCDAALMARADGALFWPDQRLLVVSDLHMGRSERLARRGGGLLPPYDSRATLLRLDHAIEETRPERVICLGDSFDDMAAAEGLDEPDRLWLIRLMAGRDWIWVEGNHDPGPIDIGGTHRAEVTVAALTFRHIAETGALAEVSGHYHPKLRIAGQSHRAFLLDAARLILPAFGTYTGGLAADDPVLMGLMGPQARAILCTGRAALPVPLPAK